MSLISSLGEINLDALSKEITTNALNVFVYDTRRDIDGGKWRKRTKKTSWYNETLNTATRGARREFPAVAVLVLTSTSLTIYDGDDPDMPMWMVFTLAPNYLIRAPYASSFYILNAKLVVTDDGNYSGSTIDFIMDGRDATRDLRQIGWGGNIADRNTNKQTTFGSTLLVGTYAKDVAMTVLPNAPIDPATGLPIPTIAVATNNGVSVIKDDGSVVDITASNIYKLTTNVSFDGGKLIWGWDGYPNLQRFVHVFNTIPSSDVNFTNGEYKGFADAFYGNTNSLANGDLKIFGDNHSITKITKYDIGLTNNPNRSLQNHGIIRIYPNHNSPSNGLFVNISKDFNTGWMHGDIKGAFLSDTDDTDVTGGALITGEDSNFNSGTIGNWTVGQNSGTALLTNNSNRLQLSTNSSSYPKATLNVGTQQPGLYTLSGEYYMTSSAVQIIYDTGGAVNTNTLNDTVNTWNYFQRTFEMTTSFDSIGFRMNVIGGSHAAIFDNLTLSKAEPDRSLNNKGLQVFGTITKTPVATGADLVAYSGFSNSNYLQQPHHTGLEVGTGDFYVMGWFKGNDSTYNAPFEISSPNVDDTGVGSILLLAGPAYPGLRFYTRNNSSGGWIFNTNGVHFVDDNSTWNFVCCLRRSGVKYIYMNGGAEVNAGTHSDNLTETDSIMRLGYRSDGSASPWTGSLSLWRFGQGAPSAEQIKKIYEDEKVLFQENTKCTLYGSSDAVTALAYDEKTNLLHVGTSSGRSDFRKLRRINNTTTGITTAISASNGLIAEQ